MGFDSLIAELVLFPIDIGGFLNNAYLITPSDLAASYIRFSQVLNLKFDSKKFASL